MITFLNFGPLPNYSWILADHERPGQLEGDTDSENKVPFEVYCYSFPKNKTHLQIQLVETPYPANQVESDRHIESGSKIKISKTLENVLLIFFAEPLITHSTHRVIRC